MNAKKVLVQLKNGTKLGEVSSSATIGAAKLASKALGREVHCQFARRNGEYVWEVIETPRSTS